MTNALRSKHAASALDDGPGMTNPSRKQQMTSTIERLRELLAKATPGPWEAEPMTGKGSWIRGSDGNWSALSCGETERLGEANARLIADGVSALPALLDHIASLEGAMAERDLTASERLKDIGVEGRVPSISKHMALNVSFLRDVIARLDATDKEAADVLVWALWWNTIDENRWNFLTAYEREQREAAEAKAKSLEGENERLRGLAGEILKVKERDDGSVTLGSDGHQQCRALARQALSEPQP